MKITLILISGIVIFDSIANGIAVREWELEITMLICYIISMLEIGFIVPYIKTIIIKKMKKLKENKN